MEVKIVAWCPKWNRGEHKKAEPSHNGPLERRYTKRVWPRRIKSHPPPLTTTTSNSYSEQSRRMSPTAACPVWQ